ncbi:MAG: TauD/TfdA family dioxygenase [Hyphomicrobiaceae bacterium]|nr:TauD/TfdA family dioxygenase [Hyphomicrobiaceae bacterium]
MTEAGMTESAESLVRDGRGAMGWAERAPMSRHFDLANQKDYLAWRDEKLARYPRSVDVLKVALGDIGCPSGEEKARITDLARRANMAIYMTTADAASLADASPEALRPAMRAFGRAFELDIAEAHRSAENEGIVAIEVADTPAKRGFIPYTTKALSWHTDGYYNQPEEAIGGMLLHCVRPASQGGVNALLDPEIAYIRLRDRSPALIAALMHPEAMSIPESVEDDGSVRPVSTGPVFIIDAECKTLTMRYTARTRSVFWRDDDETRAAVAMLNELLSEQQEPLILHYRLAAGEGLISNNVLHTRTAFENDGGIGRLLYRVRYTNRIAGT